MPSAYTIWVGFALIVVGSLVGSTRLQVPSLCVALAISLAGAPRVLKGQSRPEVVSIRVEHSCGMCTARYHQTRVSVQRGGLTAEFAETDLSDSLHHRPRIEKRRISEEQWNDLRNAVDSTVVAALVGRIGCPGCTDSPVDWVEIAFSDGSTRFLEVDDGATPRAVKGLIARVEAMLK